MKLLSLRHDGSDHLGAPAPDGQTVVALAAAGQARDGRPAPGSESLLELLQAGPAAIE